MKFTLATLAALAATAVALPPANSDHNAAGNANAAGDANGPGAGNGLDNKDNSNVRFPTPPDMTVEQASAKCGDQAQLSCCNKATYAGDTTDIDEGILAGTLSNLIGTGSGSEGLGLFDQCSKLPLQISAIIGVNVQDLLDKHCQQNIACCQDSPSDASDSLVGLGLPCVALGSLI